METTESIMNGRNTIRFVVFSESGCKTILINSAGTYCQLGQKQKLEARREKGHLNLKFFIVLVLFCF